MNTDSIYCRRVPYPLPSEMQVQPGDFSWGPEVEGTRHLYLCLPGDTNLAAIKVQRGAPGGLRVWGWDGNEDKPTIAPSIHCPGLWHGYLEAGHLRSC